MKKLTESEKVLPITEYMRKTEVKPGNKLLFYMFIFLNGLLFFSSLGILVLAIYLFALTNTVNGFTVSFLIIGILLILMAVCSIKLKKRMRLLTAYLWMQFALICAIVLLSLVLILNKKRIKDWARQLYMT